jgi:hypothetical protein
MLLISLPFRGGLEALVSVRADDTSEYRMRQFSVDGKWFQIHPMFPITKQIIARASAVRDLLVSCTNIGRDDDGEITDAMRQLMFVMKLLPNAITSVIEFCVDFYSHSQPEDGAEWMQKIVKLVDTTKGPQLITDPRIWFKDDRDMQAFEQVVGEDVEEQPVVLDGIEKYSDDDEAVDDVIETPVRRTNSSWRNQRVSPSTVCSQSNLQYRPDQLRVGRERMKYIGYSLNEIDSRFPIW